MRSSADSVSGMRAAFRALTRASVLLSLLLAGCARLLIRGPQCQPGVKACVVPVSGDFEVRVYGINQEAYPVHFRLHEKRTNLGALGDTGRSFVVAPRTTRVLKTHRKQNLIGSASLHINYEFWHTTFDTVRNPDYVYRLPYPTGAAFPVTQGYGGKATHQGPAHYSLDFGLPLNTAVYAAREGEVIQTEAAHDTSCFEASCEKFANFVGIRHADGTVATYAHLRKHGVAVKTGDTVRRGQLIGYSGDTGRTRGPHLHFMVTGGTRASGPESRPTAFKSREGASIRLLENGVYTAVD